MIYILLIYFCILIRNVIWLIVSGRLLHEKKQSSELKINSFNEKLYIIIPLLYEKNIVHSTLNSFYSIIVKKCNYNLVFVTTSKEVDDITTNDILSTELKKHNYDRVFLYNYPSDKGVMAHQLNYAIKKIKEMEKGNFWICIYNADSRISEKTFFEFEKIYINNINYKKYCIQQYSYYEMFCGKHIINSCVMWQNRWSILFEYSRAIYQNIFVKKMKRYKYFSLLNIIFGKMNYVIGHGLFISNEVLESVGGFPEDTINEDAFLGFKLNVNDIKIIPMGILEKAEFTNRISVYLKQQNVWFNGPFDAWKYYKIEKSQRKLIFLKKFEMMIYALKLFLHAIYWLVSPIIMVLVLPSYIMIKYGFEYIIIYLLFIWLYLDGINYLIYFLLNKNGYNLRCNFYSFGIIAYFLHGVGAIINIIQRLRGKNSIMNKYKTERNK